MSTNLTKYWLKVAVLTLSSPLFAGVFLLTTALIASVIPFPSSTEQWLSDDMLLQSVSYAVFTAVLSIDAMAHAFYVTAPVLVGCACVLLWLDLGLQSKLMVALVSASSMGVVYALVYLAGTTQGWIDPAFYT
jgi:hypothetical protein